MKHKEITIAGKQVMLGYCYATEIAYKEYSGENIEDFIMEAAMAINGQPKRMPDTKRTIYCILAAIVAYYNSKDEEPPVRDTDLINEASPTDLGAALGTVIALRAMFYEIPNGEPKEKGSRGKGKRKN